LQVVLFDDESGPDQIEQLVLCHHAIASFDQCRQHVERARAQGCWMAADQQLARGGLDLDVAEAVGI
jgi:hypothetical protein